jgi:REP element-mobilizing transposase RayT
MDDTWSWLHITSHTYGAWLHGSPKGYRTRHHREHIEGDYKNPPPKGEYDDNLKRSKQLLKQEPVKLANKWRKLFGQSVLDKMNELGAEVICIAMGATHVHLLAKMPPGKTPRQWVGRAKKHANFTGKDEGWTGKLWAVRCKVTPINDRDHQVNTFRYIVKHLGEGAWVWDYHNGEHPFTIDDDDE